MDFASPHILVKNAHAPRVLVRVVVRRCTRRGVHVATDCRESGCVRAEPLKDFEEAMRAFVTPSIFWSVLRRSKGLTQFLYPMPPPVNSLLSSTLKKDCGTSVHNRDTSVARSGNSGPGASSAEPMWPLGLDPDNCKIVDIRQEIKRRYVAVATFVLSPTSIGLFSWTERTTCCF